jgi:hypothetical protein
LCASFAFADDRVEGLVGLLLQALIACMYSRRAEGKWLIDHLNCGRYVPIQALPVAPGPAGGNDDCGC